MEGKVESSFGSDSVKNIFKLEKYIGNWATPICMHYADDVGLFIKLDFFFF